MKIVKISAVSTLISASVGYAIWTVSYILLAMDLSAWNVFFKLYFVLIGWAMTFGYIFLYSRLIQTFKESVYELDIILKYVHIFIIIVCQLLIFSLLISLSVSSLVAFYFLLGSAFFIVGIGWLHLIFSFNYNLFRLVLQQKNNGNNDPDATSIKLDIRQHRMLSVVRKHSILGLCMMMVLGINLIITVIAYFGGVGIQTNDEFNLDSDVTITIIWAIGHFSSINTFFICLYIGFWSNHKCYQCMCGCIDSKCKKCCEMVTKSKIQQRNLSIKENTAQHISIASTTMTTLTPSLKQPVNNMSNE